MSAKNKSFAVGALALCACAVGPNFVRPAAPATDRYLSSSAPTETSIAEGQSQRFDAQTKVSAHWWQLFSNDKLDQIVQQALANNFSLQAAQASLAGSQDNMRAGYGVFFPQVGGTAGAARLKSNPRSIGASIPSSIFSLFTMSVSISYVLDIWGGERRQVEALGAQVDAQRYTVLGAYLTLTGNIVNTVIAQAAYRAQIDATNELITLEKEQVEITQVQARAGTVPYSNVLTLQSQLASTEATVPPLAQKVDQAKHLLATLSGQFPSQWKQPEITIADLVLPENLPLSVPSELVRQRPDILLAEAQMHAANANIGVATAAMLPRLALSPSFGVNNTSLSSLFSSGSFFWNLGANLAGPILDGGTLYYQRKAAIDSHDQTFDNYRQTVLLAFEQVADTLRGLEHDADALGAEAEAVGTSEEALHLVQINYKAGLATYLQVLVADGLYLQAQIGHIQAVAQRLQDTVALYLALGGGWWTTAP